MTKDAPDEIPEDGRVDDEPGYYPGGVEADGDGFDAQGPCPVGDVEGPPGVLAGAVKDAPRDEEPTRVAGLFFTSRARLRKNKCECMACGSPRVDFDEHVGPHEPAVARVEPRDDEVGHGDDVVLDDDRGRPDAVWDEEHPREVDGEVGEGDVP